MVNFSQSALIRPSAEAYIGRGLVRKLRGEAKLAIADFDRALEIDPKNLQATRQRAFAKLDTDEIEAAIADCDRILSANRKDAEVLSLKCFALGIKGELDEAMMACETAIEVDPQLATAYMRRGLIWAGKGDDIKAKADYDEAVRLGDDSARLVRSRILYQQGEFQKAFDDLSVLIELQPKNPEFYFKRATVSFDLKQPDKAIEDLTQVINLNPMADAYTNRGIAWVEKNEFAKAMQDFNEAIKLDPSKPLNFHHRANLHAMLQQHKEADSDLTEFLRLVPDNVPAHVHRGLSRLFSADFDNAIKDFDFAIGKFPNDPELHLYRGSALNGKKEFERAINDFSRTIELAPESAEAYTYRGVALNALGERRMRWPI